MLRKKAGRFSQGLSKSSKSFQNIQNQIHELLVNPFLSQTIIHVPNATKDRVSFSHTIEFNKAV